MGRRSSGWTVVKAIARDIDRANRQYQRAVATQQRAALKEQERNEREQQKYIEKLTKELTRSQERFNKTLEAANSSQNISIKEVKLREAKAILAEVKEMERQHSFFTLGNMSGVEDSIKSIQSDLDNLKSQEKERTSLELSAIRKTEEAEKTRKNIENTLVHTLSINDALNWVALEDHQSFLIPVPVKPFMPLLPPKPELYKAPESPNSSAEKYKPKLPFYIHFMQEKKREILQQAKAAYDADFLEWENRAKQVEIENENILKVWKEKESSLLAEWDNNFKKACDDWSKRKEEHEKNLEQYNKDIWTLKSQYENFEKAAIEEYCKLVLSRSEYFFKFSKDFQIEYYSDTKLLALDYQLPTIDVVPELKEEKFIKSKNEIKVSLITEKQRNDSYERLLYAMIIRTIHEIFEADTIDAIDAISMNGWVTTLNKATGHDETRCIVTISAKKEEFSQINLANVDPKECFKNLKGVGSSRLSELVPVAPVIVLNREDRRFIQSYDVIEDIIEGDNLALMNWEDFEHLIRELFEKEFCSNGSEVKVTQASRDGGVDAVIYDPDPIRGGKIVIQAKRYSNTVGVSAVRDLYGTVQHEGAMKGILITTSGYGSDAYDFAKGKPITLMNGGNLIYLLERHGRKARIDLSEAKRALKA